MSSFGNDEKFERGLAALVDLYLHMCGLYGPEKLYRSPEKAEAAHYFVTEFQKRMLDAGPQPTPAPTRVTNFYDAPAAPTPGEDSAKQAAAPVGESSPPAPRDPAAELAAANAPPIAPPSASAIDALMSED